MKSLMYLFAFLITFECFASFIAEERMVDEHSVSVQEQPHKTSFISVLFQKTEEEKTEEKRDKTMSIELADFSQLPILLSKAHSPHIHFIPNEHRFDLKPSLFKLHQVFII